MSDSTELILPSSQASRSCQFRSSSMPLRKKTLRGCPRSKFPAVLLRESDAVMKLIIRLHHSFGTSARNHETKKGSQSGRQAPSTSARVDSMGSVSAIALLLLCTAASCLGGGPSFRSFANAFRRVFSRGGAPTAATAPIAPTPLGESSIERITRIMPRTKVTVVGGGISGLAACMRLMQYNITDFTVLEASDAPGGRVRTDIVDGYRLDRGFQVFIDSYPEAKKLFDYDQLDLQPFLPGAVIRADGDFHLVSDPLRRPQDIFASLNNPVGTLDDKIKVGLLSLLIRFQGYNNYVLEERGLEDGLSTGDYLSSELFGGISESMVDKFFKPFYGGIFLNSLDKQSARMFRFVFKMFSVGQATLPRMGMGELAVQLANKTPIGNIHYKTRATKMTVSKEGGPVTVAATTAGSAATLEYQSDFVIVAADPVGASRLLDESAIPASTPSPGRGSTVVYFGIDGPPPLKKPILVLNGEEEVAGAVVEGTRVNNVCFPSQVSPAYAPEGRSLCSATVLGCVDTSALSDDALQASVRAQLSGWFGAAADVYKWTFLRAYRIPYAQPEQSEPYRYIKESRVCERVFICGDHTNTATLNGAISSGTKAADAIAAVINGAVGVASLRQVVAAK